MHNSFLSLDETTLYQMNRVFSNKGIYLPVSVAFYGVGNYGSPMEKIACIVLNILKNDIFVSGVKETALMAYLILCDRNYLTHLDNDDNLVSLFNKLEKEIITVEDCASLLFPRKNT